MPMIMDREHKLFCQYHPVLGWEHLKNFEGQLVTEEYKTLERFNSRGIRGPEYSLKKNKNEYRILVVGDSFAEGYSVGFHELFSEVLKKELNLLGVDRYFEVINAGVGGYSTDQEFLWFKEDGVKYHPDLVVVMFYGNDVWYNNQKRYWRGSKPLFVIDEDRLLLTNVPAPRINKEINQKKKQKVYFYIRKIKDFLGRHSKIYSLFRYYSIKTKLFQFRSKNKTAGKGDILSNPFFAELRIWRKDIDPAVQESWLITEKIFSAFKQSTDMHQVSLLVFYIPNAVEIYLERWQKTKIEYGLDEKRHDYSLARNKLGSICNNLDIFFIDPTETFIEQSQRVKPEELYYKHDNHWNKDGHRLAGNILAAFVKEFFINK